MSPPRSRIKGAVTVNSDYMYRMRATARRRDEENCVREKKLAEPFSLKVGECGCAGDVMFNFEGNRYAGSLTDFRIGGKNPMKEVYHCSCSRCGELFDRNHPPIAEAIKTYRDSL